MEQDIKIFSKINKAIESLKDFCRIQNEIIQLNNASYAYLFVKDVLENVSSAPLRLTELKNIILQETTPLNMQYQFALLLKNKNIKMDNSVIIARLEKSGDTHHKILAKSLAKNEVEEEMSDIIK